MAEPAQAVLAPEAEPDTTRERAARQNSAPSTGAIERTDDAADNAGADESESVAREPEAEAEALRVTDEVEIELEASLTVIEQEPRLASEDSAGQSETDVSLGKPALSVDEAALPEDEDDDDQSSESSGDVIPFRRARPPMHAGSESGTFEEGDHVVYPTHGVGKVERIAVEEIAGHKLELIHITFEENRMTLRVPVSKARTAGLRKLATRTLFEEALAVLKGRARIKRTMWSRRAQEYEAKINSGDPLAIAEVVRDLHRNAGQPDQSFSERQIYEAAMDRLAAELAALDSTDKLTAAAKLAEHLKPPESMKSPPAPSA